MADESSPENAQVAPADPEEVASDVAEVEVEPDEATEPVVVDEPEPVVVDEPEPVVEDEPEPVVEIEEETEPIVQEEEPQAVEVELETEEPEPAGDYEDETEDPEPAGDYEDEADGFGVPVAATFATVQDKDVDILNKAENEAEYYDDDEESVEDYEVPQRVLGILLALIGCSLLVLVEGGKSCCQASNKAGYAVGIGTVSLFTGLAVVYFGHVRSSEAVNGWEIAFATAMFCIWLIGVFAMTFTGVFENPGTGYFSTWLSVILAGYYVSNIIGVRKPELSKSSLDKLHQDIVPYIAVLTIFDIGVLVQVSIGLASDGIEGRGVFTLVVCILTLLMSIPMVLLGPEAFKGYQYYFYYSSLFLFLWTFVVLFATMSDPFYSSTGELVANGFYATLGCFATVIALMWHCHVLDITDKGLNGNKRFAVSGRQILVFVLGLCSFFVFVFGIVDCNRTDTCDNAFATTGIAAGFFSTVVVVLTLFLLRSNPDYGDKIILNPNARVHQEQTTAEKVELMSASFLSFIWVALAAVLTFPSSSPYFTTNTGYFAVWACLVFSVLYLRHLYPKQRMEQVDSVNLACSLNFPNNQRVQANFGLVIAFVGSIVELAAASSNCIENTSECNGEEYFVFAVVAITLLIVSVLLTVAPADLGHGAIIVIFFFIFLWFISLAIITTRGPFTNAAGNGFYACWMILFGALYTMNNYEWQLPQLSSSSGPDDI